MGSEGLGVTTQARLSFNMSYLLSSGALSVSTTSEEDGLMVGWLNMICFNCAHSARSRLEKGGQTFC